MEIIGGSVGLSGFSEGRRGGGALGLRGGHWGLSVDQCTIYTHQQKSINYICSFSRYSTF